MLTQAKFSNQYQGILVKIGGRLRGVQRAKRLQLSYGGISAQTARSFLLSNNEFLVLEIQNKSKKLYLK